MSRVVRRKLQLAAASAVFLSGLTAGGLAWAQQAPTTSATQEASSRSTVFIPTPPLRILDTRLGVGTAAPGPLGPDKSITLKVAGVGHVPANASGAAVNVTVFDDAVESFVTVWPTGGPRPGTSLVNPQPKLVLSQAASVGLGNGSLDIYNAAGSTHVIVDLVGYYQNTTDVPGLTGAAHFLTGAVDPTTEGVIGDMYVNTTTNNLFGPKTASGWGPPTPLGGARFITGTVDPTSEGSAGDMYINTATNTLYGPKTAAGWGNPTPLGGSHFLTGSAEPTNEGVIGDMYINTATNTLYGPKPAAGWGTGKNLDPALLSADGPAAGKWSAPSRAWTTVPGASLTLPAGKWLIQAKGNDAAANSAAVDFRIVNQADNSVADYMATTNNGSQRVPFSLSAPVSVSEPTVFALQVLNSSRIRVSVDNVRINATQLSSINGS